MGDKMEAKTKTVTLKKCKPTFCLQFSRIFIRICDKRPADEFVVKCPYRTHDNFCINEKETLTNEYLPALPKPKKTGKLRK
jgi:hypothetical protein